MHDTTTPGIHANDIILPAAFQAHLIPFLLHSASMPPFDRQGKLAYAGR